MYKDKDCKYTRKIELSYSEIGIFKIIKSKKMLKLVLLFLYTTFIFLVQHVYIL